MKLSEAARQLRCTCRPFVPFRRSSLVSNTQGHFEVRMVRNDGTIKWRGAHLFVSDALIGEPVGLEEVHDAKWLMRFSNIPLAVIDDTGPTSQLIRTPIR